jgi:hypothetical protein
VPVFGRRAASPLHARTLASNSLPRDVSGNPPLRDDNADFYRYYLTWGRPRKLQLQPWILRIRPTDLDAEEGLDVLDDVHSSMFQVARALEVLVFRYQRRDTESLHETMSPFERAKPGQRALLWLLKSNAVRDIAFLKHPTLLRAISHCLVAEGGFRWLQDWLTQEDNPMASLTDSKVRVLGQPDNFWRGRLLLHTMEAQAY